METEVTPKQWLADNGHLPREAVNKQGRLSAVNVKRVEEAVANGARIKGYSVTTSAKPTDTSAGAKTVTRTAGTGEKVIADIGNPTRSLDLVPVDDTGKVLPIGIKGVCDNCRSSFTYCWCPHPVSILDGGRVSVVTFKPKG